MMDTALTSEELERAIADAVAEREAIAAELAPNYPDQGPWTYDMARIERLIAADRRITLLKQARRG